MDTTTQPELISSPSEDQAQPDPKMIETDEQRRRRYRARLKENSRDREERLVDFLLALRRDIRKHDYDARMKQIQDIDLMCRYCNGDQWGDYVNGVYTDLSRDGDFAYTIPVIEGHVEQAFMQMLKTRVEYEFSPKNKGNPSHVQLSGMAETLAVAEKDRLMTEDLLMDEIQNAIVAGESYRCLIWGIPEHPRTVKRVNYKTEDIEIPGGRKCRACNADVPEGEEACSSCGATFIKEIPAARAVRNTARGTKEVPLCENILRIPHPMAVKRDLGAQKFPESSYVLESDYLSKQEAEWLYQTIITSSEGLTEEMRVRQDLERSSTQTDAIVGSANPQGYTASQQSAGRDVQRDRLYVDVSRYGHFPCSVEETLPDDTKLPKGTILGDKYPRGLFIEYVGDKVMKFKPLNWRRRWSVVLYKKQAGSGKGKGMQSLIPLQDIVNDTFNLDYGIAMSSGRPLTVINGKYIDEPPEAGQFLKVNKAGVDDVNKVVAQFPGQSASGIVPMIGERIDSAMQFIEGTYSLQGSVGAPDQRAMGTATGIAAVTENSSGRFIGPIKQRIHADKELMFQILENIRDFSSPEQKKELAKRFGPDVCAIFFQCNFRQTLNIGIAQNTDQPRSMALTQANMFALAQAAASLKDAPGGMEILSMMADNLGFPLNIGAGRSDRREAEYRLNKLAAIEERITAKNPAYLLNAQVAAGQMFALLEEFCGVLALPDEVPPELAETPEGKAQNEMRAAFIFMPDHPSFMDTYKDALLSEEAKASWSDARKLVAVQLWMEHYKAQLAGELEKAKLMQEAQQPEQPDPEQIKAAQAEEDKRQLTAMAIQQQVDEEKADAEHQRQLDAKAAEHDLSEEAKDADLEREVIKQGHQAHSQLAVEGGKQLLQGGAQ